MPETAHQMLAPMENVVADGLSEVAGLKLAAPIADTEQVEDQLDGERHRHAGQHCAPRGPI